MEESGAWIDAAARAALPRPCRKSTEVGPGMTMPMRAASRSIRWASESDETLVRSCSLRVCSELASVIERPMLALSFSTSTCIAMMPASMTPSTGIQALPRTRRSSRGWSGRPRTNSAARPDSEMWLGRVGRARTWRPGPDTRRGAAGATRARTGRGCAVVLAGLGAAVRGRLRAAGVTAAGVTVRPRAFARLADGRIWSAGWTQSRRASARAHGGSEVRPPAHVRKRTRGARGDTRNPVRGPRESA